MYLHISAVDDALENWIVWKVLSGYTGMTNANAKASEARLMMSLRSAEYIQTMRRSTGTQKLKAKKTWAIKPDRLTGPVVEGSGRMTDAVDQTHDVFEEAL